MRRSGVEEEVFEEELFGPAEGLHSTFRIMRDELLDTVARVGGPARRDAPRHLPRRGPGGVRYLELIKVAALIERAKEGQTLDAALPEVNEILLQCATPEQREMLRAVGARRLAARHRARPRRAARPATQNGSEPSLDPFIPRRGRGPDAVGLGHRDLPDLPAQVQVRARLPDPAGADDQPALRDRGAPGAGALPHAQGGGSLDALMELFEVSWRRSGFGDSDDELQFRERAVDGARALLGARPRLRGSEPVWFERSFAFKLGPHLLRGRVDRVDRHPDGTLRADRLQDRQGQDRGRAARGRAAVASTRWARASRGGSRPRRRATSTC